MLLKKNMCFLIFVITALLFTIIFNPYKSWAYHYPWDQNHDTTKWNDPSDPGPTDNSNCNPCNGTNSPVYISTGHFIWMDTDIKFKGRSYLGISRTYNSHDPIDGLFGNGWVFDFDKTLVKVFHAIPMNASLTGNPTNPYHYVLRMPNGKRYDFKVEEDGTITPPASIFDIIEPQNDGTTHLIKQDGTVEVYSSRGKLISTTDPNGNTLTFTYDNKSKLTRAADDNGRYLDFAHNSSGRIGTITDHTNRTWSYSYDANGSLISVTDPLGGVLKYDYQPYQPVGDGHTYYHITKITDPTDSVITEVVYDKEKVKSYTEGENLYTYLHQTQNNKVTKTDSMGNSWTYVYTDDGLTASKTDPLGNISTHEYDNNGLETKLVDELGKVWTATYDASGRRLTQTNPLGQTITLEYTGTNPYPVKIKSPTGRITELNYDSRFNPSSIKDAAGALTTIEWSSKGEITGIVDALNNRNVLSYNQNGLPVGVTDPLGRMTQFTYDEAGNRVQIQNPEQETSKITYDALDRVVQVTDPLNQLTTYSYDEAGRILSLTDPANATTSYKYDKYGRIIERTAPDNRKITYQYRSDNRISQITQPDGSVIKYQYDKAGRLTLADAGGESTSYSYTKRGELAQAQNPTGTVKLTYDDAGRMIQETINGQTVDLKFNQENERVQLSALGIQTNYTYDSIGRLTGITTGQKQYDFAYDILGRRTSLALPNNSTTGYTYDNASQLTGISHSGAFNASYSYSFDNVGRIVKWSGDGSDWNYQYDQLGRLTNAGHGSDVFDYDYDELGNIQGNGSQYDIANRLTHNADYNYTYDLNGNLKQKQDKSSGAKTVYTWNAKNQLVKCERYDNATAATPTKVLSFTYGPLGRRWSKTEDGNTEQYVYDGYNLIGVLDKTNNLVRSFTFGTGIDEPLGLTKSGSVYYYHANHQGSIMGLTDESGSVAIQYSYTPYGKTASTGNPSINPFQYTGREFDADDLYYYRARYYNPSLGRYLSPDPIGLEGGINLYAYCLNDPVNLIDPKGLLFGGLINAGESYGQSATEYYAQITIDPNASTMAKAGAWVGGVFASAWTPQTSDSTALTLLAAGTMPGAARWAEWSGNPAMYEIGAKTVPTSVWNALGLAGMSVTERGAAIWAEYGWGALGLSRGPWLSTFTQGPTPGGWLAMIGLLDYAKNKYGNGGLDCGDEK